MNKTVTRFSNCSQVLKESSTWSWGGECWEWALEQIFLLAFRRLTHSLPMSGFVAEKGVRREERESTDTKRRGAYGKGGPSRVFQ